MSIVKQCLFWCMHISKECHKIIQDKWQSLILWIRDLNKPITVNSALVSAAVSNAITVTASKQSNINSCKLFSKCSQ